MIHSKSFLLTSIFLLCILFGCNSFLLNAANEYNIIPFPQKLIPEKGTFSFNKKTVIYCTFQQADVKKLAQQFSDQFALVSGLKLEVSELSSKIDTSNSIIFQSKDINPENIEAYLLNISPKTIRIEAQATNGFFYGLQSLYQLLPAEIYGKKKAALKKWSAPSVQIYDAPRFAYRGMHLDVCRHYFPVEFIKKYIDALTIHKFNNFHWHLTEDQGWRIEIKKYPLLTQVGSKRAETMIDYYFARYPQQFDGKSYGGFYTQDEAREIVAYAKERFITVIPEIELPGHAQAAIASYPYLSCTQDSTIKVATRWGIFPDVYCPRDTTFTFLEDVLTEIMDLFPSKYIHIGGDECTKDRWKTCSDCQALIKKLNLKDENGLQSYFVERIEKFVNSKGRRIIGWDEILDGGLAPNATVMSWRGTKGGIAAAKSGHDVIMTPTTYCYFDHYQADPVNEPVTIGGYLPMQTVYQFDPVPADLTAEESKHILGAQINIWTEYIPNFEGVEYMAFPRAAAMSEVLWSNKQNRNWERFRNRMITQFQRYDQLDINACKAFFEVQFQSKITADYKLQITLVCDNPEAQIRYSVNGKELTYKEPFILNESANITATALVKGKMQGKPLTKPFIVSKLTGLSYSKNVPTLLSESATVNALTDGIQGNTKVANQWLGFTKGKDVQLVWDLSTVQPIERFSVGLLNAPAIFGQFPTDVKVYGSLDGVDYKQLDQKQLAKSGSPSFELSRIEMNFPSTQLRYLKLELTNGGDCAKDFPKTGGGSVLFLDEVGAW